MPEPLLTVPGLRTYIRATAGTTHLDGVELAIEPRKTLCLVGESGWCRGESAHSTIRLIERPGRIVEDSEIVFGGGNLSIATGSELQKVRGNREGAA